MEKNHLSFGCVGDDVISVAFRLFARPNGCYERENFCWLDVGNRVSYAQWFVFQLRSDQQLATGFVCSHAKLAILFCCDKHVVVRRAALAAGPKHVFIWV